MPVKFPSDEQVAAYGRFTGELAALEVERFFYLDDADRDLIARRRSDHHRLGFAVQLGTVRAVGRFLEDPLDVPWSAVEFLAGQLGIGDASCVKKYVQRPQTPYGHAWEIRGRYGYRSFGDQGSAAAFARFLDGCAWTHTEGPMALFEHATGWLRRVRAYDLLRMFGRDGHPTPLGQAFVEHGRIAKTLHLLALVDPIDGTYQRRMNRQLTVQESRHRLGRKICHGRYAFTTQPPAELRPLRDPNARDGEDDGEL
jgi:TnpA family transposase